MHPLFLAIPILALAPAALPAQDPGCGTPAECVAAGRRTFNGDGVPRDPARSLTLFTTACQAGDLGGSVWAGFQHENGHGTARDLNAGRTLYDRACTGLDGRRDLEGCAYLANLYRFGQGVPRDYPRALIRWTESPS